MNKICKAIIEDKMLGLIFENNQVPDIICINQKRLDELHGKYHADINLYYKEVLSQPLQYFYFSPEEYTDVADILLYCWYTSETALSVMKWIKKYVQREGDGIDWFLTGIEILEGATL